MKLDRILSSATSHVETVRVSRTGVNPLLWMVGLVSPLAMTICLLLVVSGGDRGAFFAFAFLAIAVVPILIAVIAYFMIFFLKPELLESEEYRLRRQAQITAYEQGKPVEIVVTSPASAELRSLEFPDNETRTS